MANVSPRLHRQAHPNPNITLPANDKQCLRLPSSSSQLNGALDTICSHLSTFGEAVNRYFDLFKLLLDEISQFELANESIPDLNSDERLANAEALESAIHALLCTDLTRLVDSVQSKVFLGIERFRNTRLKASLSSTNLEGDRLHLRDQINPRNECLESKTVSKDAYNDSIARIERIQVVIQQETRHNVNRQRTESDGTHDIASMELDQKCARVFLWGRPPGWSHTNSLLTPQKVDVLPGQSIAEIACGGNHILYLSSAGDVYSSEDHAISTTEPTNMLQTPQLVKELTLEKALHRRPIIHIACGAKHSVALTSAGEVYSWGSGEDGRLGHGEMRDRNVPRKIMALLRHRIEYVSCGGSHTAVVSDQNLVFTFGRGRNGRLGLGDTKCHDTPQEVPTWGFRKQRIIKVVCGWNFTIALSLEGRVFSWGKQSEGQCGLGFCDQDELSPCLIEKLLDNRIVDVACGYTHSLALTSQHEVLSWGLGEYGQLGRGIVYQPSPESIDQSLFACEGGHPQRIYCGAFHSIITAGSKILYAWGLNSYGACGLGHTLNRDIPERNDFFANIDTDVVLCCGHKYTIALEVDKVPSVSADSFGNTFENASSSSNLHMENPFSNWEARVSSVSSEVLERKSLHHREEELRRAKKIWRTRILLEWEESRHSSLTHTMWRQGIPPSIRARVWPLAIGNALKTTPEMYHLYRDRAFQSKQLSQHDKSFGKEHSLSLIDTDLPRTFPSLRLFDSTGPYNEYLLQVLETYACYRPDLGYIQGMSYLAAMLCLHIPTNPYLTFQCLANLMVQHHLFTFYLLDPALSNEYYQLFQEFLSIRLPQVAQKWDEMGLSTSMYLLNWLQTIFFQILPLEIAARVFDCFLLDGTDYLFRTAMAIHEIFLDELLHAQQLEDVLPLLQRNPVTQSSWAFVTEERLFRVIDQISVPSSIHIRLQRVNQDVFFYQKTSGSMD
uniref:Regulator of chromosome condensation (RCC1)like protein putative n=1 Tax=Albugo laibachii Nc14 TaxID=890382 RepID=F0WJ79_9STRA|nr:regulator of chromosome condensation (RCC1)like protein putative [Albugo laibachii Nc14]|eukprot:CCA21326.1 regulator of chromosome condensation (RCC1)like protein putative [Albugo laibachii Nc14]